MTTTIARFSRFRSLVLMIFTLVFATRLNAQSDTLHLNYDNIKVVPHDTTLKKMDAWIKSLNGVHQDISVYAYFSKLEFKKFAQERADEMFLILNRKARSLFTIVYIGPKKGETSQRSRVDIVYKKTKTPEEIASEATAKAGEKKKSDEEKAAKAAQKASKDGDKKSSDKKSKSDVVSEQTVNADDKKSVKQEGSKTKVKPVKKEIVNGGPGAKPASKGTFITQSDIPKLKTARLIVPRTDSPEIDSMLTFAVKNFWTMNTNVEYGTMSYIEAKKLAKIEKNVLLFIVADVKSTSLTHNRSNDYKGNNGTAQQQMLYKNDNYKTVSSGAGVLLEDGKGKLALAGYFPSYSGEKLVGLEAVVFGVSQMNSLVYNLEKYNIKNNVVFNRPFRQNAMSLKDKVLLLPDAWLSEKLDLREIPALYEGKYKVVDYDTWSKAIIEKENYAYTIVVPFPSGGDFIYLHYLMDAATGNVLFISQPRMAVSVYGANVSRANTGYINEKNLKYYNDAFHMKLKEDDGDENADKATESEDKSKESASEEKKEVKKSKEKKEEVKKEESEPKKEKKEKKKKGDKETESTEKKEGDK